MTVIKEMTVLTVVILVKIISVMKIMTVKTFYFKYVFSVLFLQNRQGTSEIPVYAF